MTKIRIVRIGLIVLSAMILVGAALAVYFHKHPTEENVIELSIDNRETKSVRFTDLSMIPGEECEYTILLDGHGADAYNAELRFSNSNGKGLEQFVCVKIEANGAVVCNERLATLLDGQNLVLPMDFTKSKHQPIRIVYYLPHETGNEAQRAETSFELLITAYHE